eukprot:UN00849
MKQLLIYTKNNYKYILQTYIMYKKVEKVPNIVFPEYPILSNGFVQSFDPSDEKIHEMLEKYGFVIINILNGKEVVQWYKRCLDDIQSNSKHGLRIDPDKPDTWDVKYWAQSERDNKLKNING